jgi:hypothetical protein
MHFQKKTVNYFKGTYSTFETYKEVLARFRKYFQSLVQKDATSFPTGIYPLSKIHENAT